LILNHCAFSTLLFCFTASQTHLSKKAEQGLNGREERLNAEKSKQKRYLKEASSDKESGAGGGEPCAVGFAGGNPVALQLRNVWQRAHQVAW
jgi:hypothetical protein